MIRYKIDVMKALKEHGYSSTKMRREKILPQGTMQKLRTYNSDISLATLNTVCCLLRCNPEDVIEFNMTDEEKLKYFQ